MEENKVQRIRFRDKTIRIETVIIHGIECLRLEDVQLRFKDVNALSIDDTQLAFVLDESGRNAEPLRVQAYPDKVIDCITLQKSSEVIHHDQLDRIEGKIDRIDANTQQILKQIRYVMTQIYELHEYTTPRYFFILPAKHHDWVMIDTVHNWFHSHFKLYFLCECSDDPKELHIAPHEGYSIKKLREFIKKYGPYLLTTLTVVKVLLSIGGFAIPQLANVSTVVSNTLHSSLQSSDDFANVKDKVDMVQNFLEDPKTKLTYTDLSLIKKQNKSQSAPIQGADLRELESYLERIDCTRALGNLYRIVTDDGHVRWICQEHYDKIKYENHILVYIKLFEEMGGKFNLKTKEAILNQLKFTDTNIKMISEALRKGFNISKLVLRQCSIYEKYFDKFMDIIINRPSIQSLEFINLNILGFFDTLLYTSDYIKINLSNHLLAISLNESYQNGNKNLLVRILMQNKIHRVLQISASDFLHNEQQLKQCIDTNTIINELIVYYANNIEILNSIFQIKVNRLERLKLNYSLFSAVTVNHFCQLLNTNQTMTELDLIDAADFSNENLIKNLFHILKQQKSIKQLRLHISHIKSSDEKETLLIDLLENHSFLTHLCLSESIISSELLRKLIDTIKQRRSLIHLEFYLCNLNENDIVQLQTLENDGYLFYLVVSEQSRVFPKLNSDFDRLQLKSNIKWKLNGKTIAGGNREGDQLNQLAYPHGFYVDDQQQSIYIADCFNHRIVKWKLGENDGEIIAGGNGQRNRIDQLDRPTDVILDRNSKSLIICDRRNERVVRWSLENQQDKQVLISHVCCYGLMMNDNGDLFVSDCEKHEVKRWRKGEKEGTVVAGGNGQGDQLNQLNVPTFIFIDRQDAVYVSDSDNYRVMKWIKDAKEGVIVAGGQGQGDSLKQLSFCRGFIVNEIGDVYVADSSNNRIMCWPFGSKEGHVVVGGNGEGKESNQFTYLTGLSFDRENNLYAADWGNHRIQRFDVDKN